MNLTSLRQHRPATNRFRVAVLAFAAAPAIAALAVPAHANPDSPRSASRAAASFADCGRQENTPPTITDARITSDPDADLSTASGAKTATVAAFYPVRFAISAADLGGPVPASGMAPDPQSVFLAFVRVDNPDSLPVYAETYRNPGSSSDPAASAVYTGTIKTTSRMVGTWRLNEVRVRDAENNHVVYTRRTDVRREVGDYYTPFPDGFPDLTFTVTAADQPAAPTAELLTPLPASVDSNADLPVTVRAAAPNGIHYVEATYRFASRNGYYYKRFQANGDGTFSANIDVPEWNVRADDQILFRSIRAVSNDFQSTEAALNRKAVAFTSGVDSTIPRVRSISFSDTPVDVRNGSKLFVVNVKISDTGSGVHPGDVLVLAGGEPEEGGEIGMPPLEEPKLIKGTANNGTWRVTFEASHCKLYSKGRISIYADAHDLVRTRASHLFVYGPDYISGEKLTKLYGSTRRTKVTPTAPITVTFNQPMTGLTPASAFVYDNDYTPLHGTWNCADANGDPISCVDGPLVTGTFTPDAGQALARIVRFNPPGVLDLRSARGAAYLRFGGWAPILKQK